MINGMNIFYSSKLGSGLKVVSNNKGDGLQPVENKKGKGTCNKKFNNKKYKGSGLKILK